MAIASGFVAVAAAASGAHAADWMLMGREGGCVTLEQAAARLPLLTDIETPDQLVARLRTQGEDFRRQELEQGDVTVVQIEVPGLSLGFIFVPPSLCR